jgi:glutathione peroxidase
MRRAKFAAAVMLLLGVAVVGSVYAASKFYGFSLPAIDGKPAPLSAYRGKVVLVVNVASKCGYTPQYTGLEALYRKYKDKGVVVVGFPANNFGLQEPGTNEEIAEFCKLKYDVTFPMYAKVSVKGDDKTPLFHWLTTEANPAAAGDVKWNFTKFLIDRKGNLVARFESKIKPEDAVLTEAIDKLL